MDLLYARSSPPAHALDDAALNDLYRHPAPEDRAWVRTNFVASLDGSIQGSDGRSGSINTESDHQIFALHRAHADAVLVGAETVRTEGYRAIDLAVWQRDLRIAEGLAPYPTLVIITGSLTIDPGIAEVDEPHGPVMIITVESRSDAEVQPFTDAGIAVVREGRDRVDLAKVVDRLGGMGLPRILCEGGPRIHHDLLAAGLVDELSLTLAPTVVGGDGHRSTVGPALVPPPSYALQHVLYAPSDETLFATYRRA